MIEIPDEDIGFEPLRSCCLQRTREFFGENSPLKNAEKFGGRPYERRIQQEDSPHENDGFRN